MEMTGSVVVVLDLDHTDPTPCRGVVRCHWSQPYGQPLKWAVLHDDLLAVQHEIAEGANYMKAIMLCCRYSQRDLLQRLVNALDLAYLQPCITGWPTPFYESIQNYEEAITWYLLSLL